MKGKTTLKSNAILSNFC